MRIQELLSEALTPSNIAEKRPGNLLRRFSKTLGLIPCSPIVFTDAVDSASSLAVEPHCPLRIQSIAATQDTDEGNSPVFTQSEQSVLELFKLMQKRDARELPQIKKLLQSDIKKKGERKCNQCELLVNAKDIKGYTPIIIAAELGSFEIVSLLLENGADWRIRSSVDKVTCLEVAARWGHLQVVKLLMRQPWSREEMVQAVMVCDNWEIIRLMKMKISKRRCSLALIW